MTRGHSVRLVASIAGIALLALPLALGTPTWLDVGTRIMYYVLLVASWNLIAGYVGIFSFGHAAFAMIGAYVFAYLTVNTGVSWPVAIVGAAMLPAAIGAGIGVLSLRVREAALVVSTFAVAEIVRILVQGAYGVTGGSRGTTSSFFFGSDLVPYYLLGVLLVAAFLCVQWVLLHSHLRYYLVAIRDDEAGAAAIGLNTLRWKVITFSYSAMWAGIAGAYLAGYLGFITPTIGSFAEMAKILAMGVVGGLGTPLGPVFSTAALQLVDSQLRAVAAELSAIAYALAVLAAVVLFPRGLLHRRLRTSPQPTTSGGSDGVQR